MTSQEKSDIRHAASTSTTHGAVARPETQAARTLERSHRVGSVFGMGQIAIEQSPHAREVNLDELRTRNIIYLGPQPLRTIRMLWSFHEIGVEFHGNARSINDVGVALERRAFAGLLPEGLACSPSSVRRTFRGAAEYFKVHFSTNAPLFVTGKANAIYGLSDLGELAWRLTREFLIVSGIVEDQV